MIGYPRPSHSVEGGRHAADCHGHDAIILVELKAAAWGAAKTVSILEDGVENRAEAAARIVDYAENGRRCCLLRTRLRKLGRARIEPLLELGNPVLAMSCGSAVIPTQIHFASRLPAPRLIA